MLVGEGGGELAAAYRCSEAKFPAFGRELLGLNCGMAEAKYGQEECNYQYSHNAMIYQRAGGPWHHIQGNIHPGFAFL